MGAMCSASRVCDGRAAIARRLTQAAGSAVAYLGYFDWVHGKFTDVWAGRGEQATRRDDGSNTERLAEAIRTSGCPGGRGAESDRPSGSDPVHWIRKDDLWIAIGERIGPLVAIAAFVSEGPKASFTKDVEQLLDIGLAYSVQLMREDMANRKTTQERITDSILRSLSLSFAVVDGNGTVGYLNNLTDRWLTDRCDLTLSGDRLSARTPQIQQLLQVAIGGATSTAARTSVLQLDGSGDVPQTVVVLPIEIYPPRALLVFGQEQTDAALRDLLLKTFGLTLAERRLARHLLAGKSLADAASETSLKISTARSYLKRIFAKTGIHRQSQLISLYHSMMPPVRLAASVEELTEP